MADKPAETLTPFEGLTPLEALLERTARDPDRLAIISGSERWNCGRVVADSARLAEGFRLRSVGPGHRVAVHMRNVVEVILIFLACWRTGAIAVLLNPRLKRSELHEFMGRSNATLYIGQEDLYDEIKDLNAEVLPEGARFIIGAGTHHCNARSWSALLSASLGTASSEFSPPSMRWKDDVAMLLPTSGTTGRAKMVIWTQRMLSVAAENAVERGVGQADIVPIVTSMMHAGGAHFSSTCLLTGAVAVLVERYSPDAVLDAVDEHRCTTFIGMPSMFSDLAFAQSARARNVSSLRNACFIADACSDSTARVFAAALRCIPRSLWGATEDVTCGLPVHGRADMIRMAPDVDIQVVDDEGELTVDGDPGQMVIRSSGTTPGYWVAQEKSSRCPADGYTPET